MIGGQQWQYSAPPPSRFAKMGIVMNKEEIENILIKVSAKMTNIKNIGIEEDCPIGIIDFNNWEWPQGVGLYGIYKYYRLSHDKKLLEQLISWFDARIAEGLPKRNVNTTAPLLTLAFSYEETGRADYLEICSSWAQWIMTDMPRAG